MILYSNIITILEQLLTLHQALHERYEDKIAYRADSNLTLHLLVYMAGDIYRPLSDMSTNVGLPYLRIRSR